jgi:hypothetical protein
MGQCFNNEREVLQAKAPTLCPAVTATKHPRLGKNLAQLAARVQLGTYEMARWFSFLTPTHRRFQYVLF